MSTFFKALEQAERDRAQAEQTRRAGTAPVTDAPSVEAPPVEVPPAVATIETAPAPPVAERPVSRPSAVEPLSAPKPSTGPWKDIDDHLVSLLDPASFEAEQYRALRLTVEQLRRSAGFSVFAISSPTVGDGKTLTAVNLAGALAQAPDARVLLIDADLRHAAVAERLGLDDEGGRGLVDAILDPSLSLDDVVRRRPPYNLSVLLAGRLPGTPYEVLKSPRLGELLDQARIRYDYVLLDTPPIVSVPDCRVIGKWVDGFLVVVTAHRTQRRLVEEALNVMEASKLIGFIFNEDDHPLTRYDHYTRRSMNGDRGGRWGWTATSWRRAP
ncbi:MAG TPA: polysaccharide biosynthesis tyrosine autokinase [Methylomirabilota bacterium]|jgi:capsular exopolysaccharide synthesis family protein|nr:polysaccharide biosynthesis tyrosine autokinase [Methylomirabilota bacterium]